MANWSWTIAAPTLVQLAFDQLAIICAMSMNRANAHKTIVLPRIVGEMPAS